jgi:hypothetical protein
LILYSYVLIIIIKVTPFVILAITRNRLPVCNASIDNVRIVNREVLQLYVTISLSVTRLSLRILGAASH